MATATAAPAAPPPGPPPQRRFTVAEYQRMHEVGILTASDRCELIRGIVVPRPPVNPPHATVVTRLTKRLLALVGDALVVRTQPPVRLADSMPHPDLLLAVGTDADYESRHPDPKDVRLVVEVSDSTVRDDTGEKYTLYAAERLPVYWVVNLTAKRVEVYTDPRGGKAPGYRTRAEYAAGDAVPVVVAGRTLGTIPAADLLP